MRSVHIHKVGRWLRSGKFRKKYILPEFPDRKFKLLFAKAMRERDAGKAMEMFRKLCKLVFDNTGGFEIDGWRLRTGI